MMVCPVDDGAACVIVASTEWVKRHHPDRRLVRPVASALRSETYEPGHTFLGPVVGPATMTRDTALLAYEHAGLGPEDMRPRAVPRRLRQRGARVLRAARLLRRRRGRQARRRGRHRARRPDPLQHRRRPHRPRPPRRPHRARDGARGRAAAARRGRRAPGRRARAPPSPTWWAAAACAPCPCSKPTERSASWLTTSCWRRAARSRRRSGRT